MKFLASHSHKLYSAVLAENGAASDPAPLTHPLFWIKPPRHTANKGVGGVHMAGPHLPSTIFHIIVRSEVCEVHQHLDTTLPPDHLAGVAMITPQPLRCDGRPEMGLLYWVGPPMMQRVLPKHKEIEEVLHCPPSATL